MNGENELLPTGHRPVSYAMSERASGSECARRPAPVVLRWVAVAAACASLVAARPAAAQTVRAEWTGVPARLFVNQVVEAVLRVEVSGADLGQNIQLAPGPEVESGLVAFGQFRELEPRRSVVAGTVRAERRFRVPLTAVAPGSVRLAPRLTLGVVTRGTGFWNAMVEERRQVAVEPATFRIDAVPEAGKPTDWSGLVGQFTMEVSVEPRELAVEDLCHIRSTVTGVGRMELVQPPRLAAGPGFRTYAARVAEEDGWRKTFEQIVVPMDAGATNVGPVVLVFFDPAAGAFRTLSEGPYALRFQQKAVVTRDVFRPDDKAGAVPVAATAVTFWRPVMQGVLAIGLALTLTAAGANALRRRWRRGLLWLAVAGAVVGAALAFGRVEWGAHGARLGRDETGRAAPARSAKALRELPAGSRVRVVERAGDWVRVRHEGATVWVRADAVDYDEKVMQTRRVRGPSNSQK